MAPRTYLLQLPALAPQTSLEWIQLHKELYNYYMLRRRLLDIEKQSLQLHFIIGRAGQERLGKQELTCLYHLQEVAASSRRQLQGTKLEYKIRAKICQLRGVLEGPIEPYEGCLSLTDTTLTNQAPLVLDQIDPLQFRENLDFLLSCNTRPPAATLYKGKKTTDHNRPVLPTSRRALRVQAGRFRREDLLHDNMFHSLALFSILQGDGLPTAILAAEVDELWLQIISIIAICRGCTAEPSFFLSTLDRLLDDLRMAYG